MDHAGEELERSAKLLHCPVARAHGQVPVGWHNATSDSSTRICKGRGKAPFPCTPSPKPTTKPRSFTQRTGHTPLPGRTPSLSLRLRPSTCCSFPRDCDCRTFLARC